MFLNQHFVITAACFWFLLKYVYPWLLHAPIYLTGGQYRFFWLDINHKDYSKMDFVSITKANKMCKYDQMYLS